MWSNINLYMKVSSYNLQGANIDSVEKSEIIVYIGDENCQVDSTSDTVSTFNYY